MTDERIHVIEEGILMRIVMLSIQPKDLVTPDLPIVLQQTIVTDACRQEAIAGIVGKEIIAKVRCEGITNEIIGKTNPVVNIRVDKGIEDVVQVKEYEKT